MRWKSAAHRSLELTSIDVVDHDYVKRMSGIAQIADTSMVQKMPHIVAHRSLVVKLWLHRVADDLSGLTFQEWDPSAGSDDTSAPVAMLVNSSELRAADFPLAEVRPLQLDAVALGGRRTHGVTVRQLQGVGNSTFVLSVENDNDFRSRCE